MSPPLLLPPFSPLPSWQQCQSGQADGGKHSAGQSRGRSKGWPIDYVCVCVFEVSSVCPSVCALVSARLVRNCECRECVVGSVWCSFAALVVHSVFGTVARVRSVCVVGLCVSRRPSVTLCADRRTHASRRGLWEGGVALRGCALLLSFPFFPPSRPSSPPVLRPSPPLTYRLQVFFIFILRHLFLSLLPPCDLSPPVPRTLSSVLHHGLLPVKCVRCRRLPRCTPLAAILAQWT